MLLRSPYVIQFWYKIPRCLLIVGLCYINDDTMSTIKVKYRSVYNRRKSLDRNGKASVVIEAYQNGQCKYFETGIRLIPIEWDERKSEVKKQPGLNRLIRERILELETFELSFSANYARAFELSDFSRLNTEGNEKENKAVSFPEFALE